MASIAPVVVAKLLQSQPWDDHDWFKHCLKAGRHRDFSYWLRGDFIDFSNALNVDVVLEVGAVPASTSARALALMQAYSDENGGLVLANLKGPRPLGVIFHPCTTAPGQIQASHFDSAGFTGHMVFPTLQKAVQEFHTYVWDGRELLESIFRPQAAHH